jgi:hypothetical protein
MSNPIKDIRSLLRITNAEVDRAESLSNAHEAQVAYLSDKMEKVFHNLREFNMLHGRDLHPDVLDAFNAAWRSHEASFDVWKSYNKEIPLTQYNNLTDDI